MIVVCCKIVYTKKLVHIITHHSMIQEDKRQVPNPKSMQCPALIIGLNFHTIHAITTNKPVRRNEKD